MKKENTTAFKTRVTSLFTKAGINDFNAKRGYVFAVLTDEMRRSIMRPTTLQDMWVKVAEAVATEESIKAKSKSSGKQAAGKNDMKDLTCYTCQKKGHISPNCPENGNKSNRPDRKKEGSTRFEEETCYNCGGKGHRSPQCPSQRKDKRNYEKCKT
jgi:hypothetical protein